MALKRRSPRRFWSHLHFTIRFLGLTGLLAAAVGAGLAFLENVLEWRRLALDWDWLQAVLLGEREGLPVRIAVTLLAAGAVLAAFAVLIELLTLLTMTTGRRSVFGVNALLQAVAAAALLVGVNYWSFDHFRRYDLTRDRQFTLPADVQSQLARLRGRTTIVVYQRHKTFGSLSDKPDAFDFAAERKVVEKVQDLVEQFRAFGPQFRVVVLDEEEDYGRKLDELTRDNAALRTAIEQAPENSIFFTSGQRVQKLSFNDFYQLDKTASQEGSNLVLLYQGVEPFARKVLNVDERRPRVGIAVVHEWLTTEGPEEYGMPGLRKALAAQGFDVKDVVLKRWSRVGPPEPAVYSYEESKLDRIEERLSLLDNALKALEEQRQELVTVRDFWKKSSLDELTKKYEAQLQGRKVTEQARRATLENIEEDLESVQFALNYNKKRREAAAEDRGKLNVDTLAEQRRIADLRAKMARALADVDLLIVPRMTLVNVHMGYTIPNQLHQLDEAQLDALQEFLKSGRPVLALIGPANESPDQRMPPRQGPDKFEDLFAQLGIKFGKQTILFDVEGESFAEGRTGLQIAGINTEVPPVEFEWRPGAGRPVGMAPPPEPKVPNPIRESMKLTGRGLGKGKALDLRLRHPRPVYYDAPPGVTPGVEPEFLMASAASWNEEQPFPTGDRVPRFERPKSDANKGTFEEKRRGPFPVGVAVEQKLPAAWFDKGKEPPAVRVVAIGHGGVFAGGELSPAKEELAVNTINWLLGRDDQLPQAGRAWRYPRVELAEKEFFLWRWVGWLGLPFLFTYLGLVVLLARRVR